MKGLEDASLESNENFSETLWPSGWALGQATWAKMTLELLYSVTNNLTSVTNNLHPQPKKFF